VKIGEEQARRSLLLEMTKRTLRWLTHRAIHGSLCAVSVLCVGAYAQGLPGARPLTYVCHYTSTPIRIDGHLDDPAWAAAPWTTDFVDIQGNSQPKPLYRTRAKFLWDEHYLYIAAELQEPNVHGTLTMHDSVIFHDDDFEVFLKPLPLTDSYFEFEMNALNTSWDLFLPKPYRAGGKPDNSWDIQGLKTAVAVQGTLNQPNDTDRGWTLEIAYPLTAFNSRQSVPLPGDNTVWRMNLSRVEWLPGHTREENWVWTPQGLIDMHVPEHWGYLQFVKGSGGK
jgi:hypothetical protein